MIGTNGVIGRKKPRLPWRRGGAEAGPKPLGLGVPVGVSRLNARDERVANSFLLARTTAAQVARRKVKAALLDVEERVADGLASHLAQVLDRRMPVTSQAGVPEHSLSLERDSHGDSRLAAGAAGAIHWHQQHTPTQAERMSRNVTGCHRMSRDVTACRGAPEAEGRGASITEADNDRHCKASLLSYYQLSSKTPLNTTT